MPCLRGAGFGALGAVLLLGWAANAQESRATLAGRTHSRASAFSWDRAADETLAVYRRVARLD